MYWILAAIFLLITLAFPRLRPAGIAGLLILGALLAWGMLQRMRGPDPDSPTLPQRGQSTSPATPLTIVPLDLVSAESLKLSGSGAPFELSGRIVSRAAGLTIKSVTILVVRTDCHDAALEPGGCTVLWQDRHWMPITVPPAQAREFSVSIWMRGSAPRPRGEIKDSIELVGAMGEAVQVEKAER